ncbi:hypothetical protein [Streptomyces sp. NPDC002402]
MDRGWTVVSDLRVGDRLRTPDGFVRAVTALRDRSGPDPRTVYDLTVDGLHTLLRAHDGWAAPGRARPQLPEHRGR